MSPSTDAATCAPLDVQIGKLKRKAGGWARPNGSGWALTHRRGEAVACENLLPIRRQNELRQALPCCRRAVDDRQAIIGADGEAFRQRNHLLTSVLFLRLDHVGAVSQKDICAAFG